MKNSIPDELLSRIENGLKEYYEDVRAMTNKELLDHAFPHERNRSDFVYKEVEKRLLNSISKDELRKELDALKKEYKEDEPLGASLAKSAMNDTINLLIEKLDL